jgi:hypothetical protein
LSSVGVPNETVCDSEDIWDHDGLSRLYVDRVIARGDTARLADPRVRARVKAALGHFHALAPGLAEALQDDTQPVGPSDFHPTA